MDEVVARAIQVVVGIAAVAVITVVVLITESLPTAQTNTVVVGAFGLIGALLGVHYGIRRMGSNGSG